MASEQLAIPAHDQGLEHRQLTPMDLLSAALENKAAIDVIERLSALQEKWLAREAEIGFNEAMNRVQSKIKRIAPDLENPDKHNKWASYAAIDRVIRPIYSEEGFSLSFSDDEQHSEGHVRVICYVSRGAHTRIYRKDMPVDTKGPKGGDVMTQTHATAAGGSYAKRYLVRDIFNIAIGAEDQDGNPITMGDLMEKLDWIHSCRNLDELQKQYAALYKEAKEIGDQAAMKAIVAAKDKRKKELQ